ncbi:GNAT family N-acetyltransferase [Nocardia mangyaensis]|uniref:GNAT family N-acetyltransferase n=1 Tax=Nocardia mangyaensis TaxID=2213200 RepID=UPI002674ECE8|nr:GNAT family N-acetyltransferase [Nocardia mangyaensis]MDO3649046.1 GNAT family N-acetyltransferase [Nocardia mangyaensis]
MTDYLPGSTVEQLRIDVDDLTGARIIALLTQHHADMAATSPAESMHALDLTALRDPAVTVWSAWLGADLAGCAALKELDTRHAEIKSMRTADGFTGRGVAAALLGHLVTAARDRGYRRLSLETGAEDYFAPARRLYLRHGFTECPPFGAYVPDPLSQFFTLALDPE